MSGYRFVEADELNPTSIEHRCEEIWAGDQLTQGYNYLVYHFEMAGRYFWARAYLGDVYKVYLYGPFKDRATMASLPPSRVDEGILDYLQRRFETISVLGEHGYEEIWSRDN